MKKDIHPKYFKKAKVTCACGNIIEVGSTMEEIQTELCSKCHPFFTGTQKLVDTARRVDKFKDRAAKKTEAAKISKGKTAKRKALAIKKTAKTKKVKEDK